MAPAVIPKAPPRRCHDNRRGEKYHREVVRWGGSENGITCAKTHFGEKKQECPPLSTFHVVPGIKRGNQPPRPHLTGVHTRGRRRACRPLRASSVLSEQVAKPLGQRPLQLLEPRPPRVSSGSEDLQLHLRSGPGDAAFFAVLVNELLEASEAPGLGGRFAGDPRGGPSQPPQPQQSAACDGQRAGSPGKTGLLIQHGCRVFLAASAESKPCA